MEQIEDLIGIISIAGKPVPVGGEPYTGSYSVTPKVTAQTLPTQNKVLTDNVSISQISYYETQNPKGYTVIIGEV